jgi:arylsulfatase A-like enzyme
LSKLNLVILTPDQYRSDYLGCYGHPNIGTAHIDRLAQQSVRFDRCYCASPLCGPSRISFATSLRVGEHGRRNYWSCIDYATPNLVRLVNEAGYRTGMFGKNHLFLYDQLEHIWDELHEVCLGNYDAHPQSKRAHSAFALEADHPYNQTARLTDEAIRFMKDASEDQPFLCWVNWQDPHPAFTCPEPYASLFDPASVSLPPNWCRETRDKPRKLENWRMNSQAHTCSEAEARQAIAMYMGQCKYVDDQVGRLMDYLEASGQLDNTLVVFLSDHGEFLGDFGVFHKLPLFYECLTRTPVIMRYPQGMAQPFTFQGLVEQVDLAPTLLGALGLPVPQSMVGCNLHQQLMAGDSTGRDTVLVEAGLQIPTSPGPIPGATHRAPVVPNSFGAGAMVSDGRFKLSMYTDDTHELYDLECDPHEEHNLYGHPPMLETQMRLMEALMRRTLGVGIRPSGEWTADSVDMRCNPPEARVTQWQKAELFKGAQFDKKSTTRETKLRPTIFDIPELKKKLDPFKRTQSGRE